MLHHMGSGYTAVSRSYTLLLQIVARNYYRVIVLLLKFFSLVSAHLYELIASSNSFHSLKQICYSANQMKGHATNQIGYNIKCF